MAREIIGIVAFFFVVVSNFFFSVVLVTVAVFPAYSSCFGPVLQDDGL